jgi:DNA mismatch repair protein MutS2
MTTAEAIEALDAFLNDALLAGAGEARVIHGRSGGKLKTAVHARLRQLPSIRGFRVDPRNAGVTIVQL